MSSEQMREDTLRGLGMFAGVFNELEIGLHLVIARIMEPAEYSATSALTRGMRFRDLTGALRRLADTDSVPSEFKDEVRELSKKADKLNTERNNKLHSRIWTAGDGPLQFAPLHELLTSPTTWDGSEGQEVTPSKIHHLIEQALAVAQDASRLFDGLGSIDRS